MEKRRLDLENLLGHQLKQQRHCVSSCRLYQRIEILVLCCAVLTRRRLTAVRFKWTSQGIILCYFVTNSSLTHDIQSVLWIKVYFGYLTEGQNQIRGLMLQRVLHRASCRGFTPYYYDLYTLAEKANSHVGENTTALMLQAILDYR